MSDTPPTVESSASDNPYQMPASSLQNHLPAKEGSDALSGIAGWLILPALGLIASPFIVGYQLYDLFLPLFQNGGWAQLTTPGSASYHVYWRPLLTFEIVGNIVNFVFGLVVLFYFFKRSHRAPKLFIALLAYRMVLVLLDQLGAGLIPTLANRSTAQIIGELSKGIIFSAIWIAYFSVSKRVKATFVR